jgi:type IV pilus assembly protein PilW
LVELLVALLLGLLLTGAVFSAFTASHWATRTALAVSQLTEDATLAMTLLREHIRWAGYSRSTGQTTADGSLQRAWTGRALFGCDGTFADLAVSLPNLSCTGAGNSDSLAVAYELDSSAQGNSLLSSDGRPLDCLGNGVNLSQEAGVNHYLSYSRFYIANGGLSCRGPGNPSGQVLVDNVMDMQLRYGQASAAAANGIGSYRSAADLANSWHLVRAVRVCLVVRSAEEVLEAPTPYQGCDPFGARIRPADKRLYRAFTTTIALVNRA